MKNIKSLLPTWMQGFSLKALYDKTLAYAATPQAPYVLFCVAFLESSVFPIPPDVLLIPMVLARLEKAFFYAMLCTVGSVLGGIFGYAIGYFAFDTVAQPILDFYHAQAKFAQLQGWYEEYDIWIVAAAGFSPIPYKVFTVLTGVMQANFWQFVVASALSRGARFFLIAWLLWRGGSSFKGWIERNFYPLTMWSVVVLLILVVMIKVVF